jgi:hypothetical protein
MKNAKSNNDNWLTGFQDMITSLTQFTNDNNQMRKVETLEKESSVVMTFHYDKDEETLTIRFRSGAVYEYYDVPQSTYDAFVKAESLGTYLNNEIKGVYPYNRIR